MKRRQFLRGATASALLCACGEHDLALATSNARFCGFVDPQRPSGISIQNFGLKGAARRKLPLTWNFTGTVLGVAQPAVIQSIQQAFGKWAAVAPKLGVPSMVPGNADINFVVGDLGGPDKVGDLTLGDTTPDGTKITIN